METASAAGSTALREFKKCTKLTEPPCLPPATFVQNLNVSKDYRQKK